MTEPIATPTSPAGSPAGAEASRSSHRGPSSAAADHAAGHAAGGRNGLALAALGIVFGDIGTSPLYAFQECVTGAHGVAPTPANILGVLSLIFWSLTMVVTIKYLGFLMRADNHGEGGIMALLALVPERLRQGSERSGGITLVSLLAIVGAALLFGDGIVTPAISVLSAMEGMEVATLALKPFVVPATCLILLGLFLVQRRGTGAIGALFGPVMLVWFLTVGVLGAYHILRAPGVLAALSPLHAVQLFTHHGWHGARLLGSVVLAVTGGEALYADMGHFGRSPIQRAWIFVVFPALLLCYFGQGALLLHEPGAASSLFYSMVGKGIGTYLMVVLATAATIIASQALISGVFSLTHQAVRLGYFPRVTVKHTSGETEGQIYVPLLNWGLMICCIGLVMWFQASSKLAAAYGLAVSGTMGITSLIYFVVTRYTWGWPLWRSAALLVLFLAFDIPFFLANLLKFFDGGYLPVVVGVAMATVMIMWRMGRTWLREYLAAHSPAEADFLPDLTKRVSARIPGVAVCMASLQAGIPPVLFNLTRRLRVVHETVLLLTVTTEHSPSVPAAERLSVVDLGQGFYRVLLRFGFMERYHIPELLEQLLLQLGRPARREDLVYLMAHETLTAGTLGHMGPVSESMFAFLQRNASKATGYFGIPPEQVMELGIQIDL